MNIEQMSNRIIDTMSGHEPLSQEEFNLLRKFIYEHTGISLADHKKALVYSRLAKRLRHHGLKTYGDYYDLLVNHDPDGKELVEMTNSITTNKTDFYRESHHFDFLANQIIPSIKQGNGKRMRIWCAASSTGQEPYTIAMTVLDTINDIKGWDLKILATDIDTNVLAYA
ncbi:MAG: protein-glutamate O-methyltransferase CheR, partial [Gammaproteobacteria bacterium]|nr:protein-glutamate O-methyltransferase CheR [Gammaproteobacteria bacterium]